MYIHSITISNYRQLSNVRLNFQKNLTVLIDSYYANLL